MPQSIKKNLHLINYLRKTIGIYYNYFQSKWLKLLKTLAPRRINFPPTQLFQCTFITSKHRQWWQKLLEVEKKAMVLNREPGLVWNEISDMEINTFSGNTSPQLTEDFSPFLHTGCCHLPCSSFSVSETCEDQAHRENATSQTTERSRGGRGRGVLGKPYRTQSGSLLTQGFSVSTLGLPFHSW